jgi:hypothetical protein
LLVLGGGKCKYDGQPGTDTLEDGGSFFADSELLPVLLTGS